MIRLRFRRKLGRIFLVCLGFLLSAGSIARVKRLSASSVITAGLPSHFDLRESGIITPPKNQGDCGSCWVFAAVALFEALIARETGEIVDLSEQQLVNCSAGRGCSGGGIFQALAFMRDKGIVKESELPYSGRESDCLSQGAPPFRLTDYQLVYTHTHTLDKRIGLIKQALVDFGPVATNMMFYADLPRYKSGIYIYDGSSEDLGGHNVLIVGWRDDPNIKGGGYWICKNSAGPEWGEKGYFRIAYGESDVENFYFCYGLYSPPESPGRS